MTIESTERARKDHIERLRTLENLLKDYEELTGEFKNFVKVACDFASWINETFEGTDSEMGKSILNYSKSLVKGHDSEQPKQMMRALENARGIVAREMAAVRNELARLDVNIKP